MNTKLIDILEKPLRIKTVKAVKAAQIRALIKQQEQAIKDVLGGDTTTSWALISIRDSKADTIINEENRKILESMGMTKAATFYFEDIFRSDFLRNKDRYDEKGTFFNKSHAEEIISFIKEVKNNSERLITHCSAGESRSGAIGLFTAYYFNLDLRYFKDQSPQIKPNADILSVLEKVTGLRGLRDLGTLYGGR